MSQHCGCRLLCAPRCPRRSGDLLGDLGLLAYCVWMTLPKEYGAIHTLVFQTVFQTSDNGTNLRLDSKISVTDGMVDRGVHGPDFPPFWPVFTYWGIPEFIFQQLSGKSSLIMVFPTVLNRNWFPRTIFPPVPIVFFWILILLPHCSVLSLHISMFRLKSIDGTIGPVLCGWIPSGHPWLYLPHISLTGLPRSPGS